MISHISGILENIDKDSIIIDVNGVGYKIFAPTSLISIIGSLGNKVKVFTVQIVREDSLSLYGFISKEEKNLFNALLSVSGIGPKSAMTLISVMPPDKLVAAITHGDVDLISSAPGVGKKTAQRVVVELKDKISKAYGINPSEMAKEIGDEGVVSDAISALVTLGYSSREARDVLLKLDLSKTLSVEDVIKIALKNLA